MPIIQGKILEGSTIHADGLGAYDGLVLNGYDHYRVFHSHNEFARGKAHVNDIETFWSFIKRRLSQFNGLSDKTFYLHLKENEFRFNNRHDSIYDIILKNLRKNKLYQTQLFACLLNNKNTYIININYILKNNFI